MPRRHYGIEFTKSQAERHFDKVVWKTLKTRSLMSCRAGLFMPEVHPAFQPSV
jgi:hypothetical protein